MTLPPFSFSKKPIAEPQAHLTTTSHSNILDVLSSFSMNNKKKLVPTNPVTNVYKDVDYDEKIRFPRMNNVSYTYKQEVKPCLVSRNPSACATEVQESPSNGTENYAPATFDLTQPLRRFSYQLDSIEEITHTLKKYFQGSPVSTSQVTEENLKLLKEYILNNYIYERNLEAAKSSELSQESATDGLIVPELPLSEPVSPSLQATSQEFPVAKPEIFRLPSRKSTNSSDDSRKHSVHSSETKYSIQSNDTFRSNTSNMTNMTNVSSISDMSKTSKSSQTTLSVTQFHSMKKPLCTPAVLRATLPTTPDESNLLGQVCVNNSAYSITPAFEELILSEPTREHWKSNGFTNHCMQCLTTFDYSIVSLVWSLMEKRTSPPKAAGTISPKSTSTTRRHHCRFCGHIYCDDCLIQSSDEDNVERLYTTSKGSFLGKGILLDDNARFIVPNYKSGEAIEHDSKLSKICKPCGETYKHLVVEINSKPEMYEEALFVFVENPYFNKTPMRVDLKSVDPSSLMQPFADAGRKMSDAMDPYRKSVRKDSSGVPLDWTWSSF